MVENIKIKQIASKNGLPTISVNGYFLHSRYDPIKEAQRWAEKQYKPHHVHILFGGGLGYFVDELLKKMSHDEKLIVIEPIEALSEMKSICPLHKLSDVSDRLAYYYGTDLQAIERFIHAWLNRAGNVRLVYLQSPNYERIFPELAQQIAKVVKDYSYIKALQINTLNIFAKSWQENLIRNLYPAMKAISLSDMAQKLHCPVIVASGGPSLTKQLPLLKEVKNKALILCAGSTINSLLSYGIKPHAVVTIDGAEANYLHFKGVDLHDVPLFYGLTTYWMIPAEHQGLHVIFDTSQNKELNGWLFKMLNKPLLNVMGGISIATFTLDVGRILSSGPICVIGQDLAFTGNRTHAEGNRLGKTVHIEELENRRDTLYVKGYYGEQVLTNYQFLAMKQAFEEYLSYMKSKGDHHLFVNATEGGVWIEGMEHMSFRDFVETYCQEDVSCQLAELFSQETAEPDWQRFFESIQEELMVLSRIEKLARRAEKEIEKAGKSGMTERRLEKLNQMDEELKELLQNDFMCYILNPVIYKVTQQFLPEENETPYETQQRILKQSETLYRELRQAAVFTKYCFEQLLEQVKPHLH